MLLSRDHIPGVSRCKCDQWGGVQECCQISRQHSAVRITSPYSRQRQGRTYDPIGNGALSPLTST